MGEKVRPTRAFALAIARRLRSHGVQNRLAPAVPLRAVELGLVACRDIGASAHLARKADTMADPPKVGIGGGQTVKWPDTATQAEVEKPEQAPERVVVVPPGGWQTAPTTADVPRPDGYAHQKAMIVDEKVVLNPAVAPGGHAVDRLKALPFLLGVSEPGGPASSQAAGPANLEAPSSTIEPEKLWWSLSSDARSALETMSRLKARYEEHFSTSTPPPIGKLVQSLSDLGLGHDAAKALLKRLAEIVTGDAASMTLEAPKDSMTIQLSALQEAYQRAGGKTGSLTWEKLNEELGAAKTGAYLEERREVAPRLGAPANASPKTTSPEPEVWPSLRAAGGEMVMNLQPDSTSALLRRKGLSPEELKTLNKRELEALARLLDEEHTSLKALLDRFR